MTGYGETTTTTQSVRDIEQDLAHKPKRYREVELVYRAVAQLGPMTTKELAVALEKPVDQVENVAREHAGLVLEDGEDGQPVWELAPGICRSCGCEQNMACVDGEIGKTCDWANPEETLCTFCDEDDEDGDPRHRDDDDVVDELVTGQDPALERDIVRHRDESVPATVPPDPADVSDQLDVERRAAEQLAGDDDADQELEDDAGEDLDQDDDLTERQRDILEALEDLGPNGESVSTSVLYPALAETWGIPLDSARSFASSQLSRPLRQGGHVEDRGWGQWGLPGSDDPAAGDQELEDDVDEDLVQDDDVDVDQVLEEDDASSERREADELVHVLEQLREERARVAVLHAEIEELGRGRAAFDDMVVVHDQLEDELLEARAHVHALETQLEARARGQAPIGAHPLVLAFLAFAIVVAAWVLGLWMGGAA